MDKKILLVLCMALILLSTSCSNKGITDENTLNTQKIKELESTITDLNQQIDGYKASAETNTVERQFYLDFIKNLTSSINETDLLAIAQEQWKYSILIDKAPIPTNGIVEINSDSFELTVQEEQSEFTALPLDIHVKGKISGDLFATHIKFLDIKPIDAIGTDGTIITATTYTFKNLGKNSIINLELSPELQGRLGLETTIITIKINNILDDSVDQD